MSASRITLALGAEDLLVDRAVTAAVVAARAADPSVQRVQVEAGADEAASDLRDATAPTLFGDGVVVVVTGLDEAGDAMVDAVKAVVADVPDNVTLVFTHPGVPKGKGMVDAITAAGAEVVPCAKVKAKDYPTFVAREFAAHRRKATGPAIAALCDAVGADLALIAAGVSQLAADVQSDPIDVDDVRRYFQGVADVPGFAIADAVWERRRADALLLLRQQMLAVDPAAVGPITVGALSSGLRSMVRVGGLPQNMSSQAVQRESGVPSWKVADVRRQWSRWSADQRRLAGVTVALAEADGAVKGGVLEGTSLDQEQKLLLLERFVTSTTARATDEEQSAG